MARGRKLIVLDPGQRFGRLVIVELAGRRNGNALWKCRCDCGNEALVEGSDLRSGNTKSCGCFLREFASARLELFRFTPPRKPRRKSRRYLTFPFGKQS
jgi:hypothetical protein